LELNNLSYDFGFDFDSVYMLRRRKEPTRVIDAKFLSSLDSLRAFCDYQQAISRPDVDIDLLHCAVLIARLAHPDASEDACRLIVSDIAALAREKLQVTRPPAPLVYNTAMGAMTGAFWEAQHGTRHGEHYRVLLQRCPCRHVQELGGQVVLMASWCT
jgi:hypothetical protein